MPPVMLPPHILAEVVGTLEVIGNPHLLHPDSAVFVEPVGPAMGEILGVLGGVRGWFVHPRSLPGQEAVRNENRLLDLLDVLRHHAQVGRSWGKMGIRQAVQGVADANGGEQRHGWMMA